MSHTVFIYSPVSEHLGPFHFLTTVNKCCCQRRCANVCSGPCLQLFRAFTQKSNCWTEWSFSPNGCGFGEKCIVSLAKRDERGSAGGLGERFLPFTKLHLELMASGSLESVNVDENSHVLMVSG